MSPKFVAWAFQLYQEFEDRFEVHCLLFRSLQANGLECCCLDSPALVTRRPFSYVSPAGPWARDLPRGEAHERILRHHVRASGEERVRHPTKDPLLPALPL